MGKKPSEVAVAAISQANKLDDATAREEVYNKFRLEMQQQFKYIYCAVFSHL